MYNKNGRRSEQDVAYEADTDTTSRQPRAQQQHNMSPRSSPRMSHPQHVPLLVKDNRSNGSGYGATTNYNNNAPAYFASQSAAAPQQQPYGQPVYQPQWHPQTIPLPPPPSSHRIPTQQQRDRSSSPAEEIIDASLYYSDEEDYAGFRSGGGPPMFEVSTSLPPPPPENDRDKDRDKLGNRLKSILKNTPFGELTTTVRTGHRRNNSDFAVHNKRPPVYDSLPSGKKAGHRRTSSLAGNETGHWRSSSLTGNERSPLPLHPFQRKSAPPPNNRKRSFSAGQNSSIPKPRHVRSDSVGSAASMASILSDRSIVSDISKSALYMERTEKGKVRFHSPMDNIHLVMDSDLVRGHLYKIPGGPDEEDRYVQYTMQNDDQYTDFLLTDDQGCDCQCPSCSKCHHKMEQMLYPSRYVLRVNDDIYQRVLGEIADSKHPCGLFFCGHHEDVHRPSIFIAVAIVALFFVLILVFTFLSHGT